MAVIIELSCRSLLDLVVPAKQIRVAKSSYSVVQRTISTSGHERVQAHPEQAELRFDANGNGESVALACAPARDIEATVFESFPMNLAAQSISERATMRIRSFALMTITARPNPPRSQLRSRVYLGRQAILSSQRPMLERPSTMSPPVPVRAEKR